MDTILQNLIKETYDYQQKVDAKEAEIKKLTEQINAVKEEQKKYQDIVDANRANLLNYVQDDNPVELDNIVVQLCHTTTTGYTDEEAVIKYLKEKKLDTFVKIAESIKKKDLNKELKTNESLKERLSAFTVNKTTNYIVVTDKENWEKMMVHRKGE